MPTAAARAIPKHKSQAPHELLCRLRDYRLARDLTYRQFASLIGISKSVLQRAEDAAVLCRPLVLYYRTIYKIERFLKAVRAA